MHTWYALHIIKGSNILAWRWLKVLNWVSGSGLNQKSINTLMKSYCERKGWSIFQIRFRSDGWPVIETDAPAQLETEHEDVLLMLFWRSLLSCSLVLRSSATKLWRNCMVHTDVYASSLTPWKFNEYVNFRGRTGQTLSIRHTLE